MMTFSGNTPFLFATPGLVLAVTAFALGAGCVAAAVLSDVLAAMRERSSASVRRRRPRASWFKSVSNTRSTRQSSAPTPTPRTRSSRCFLAPVMLLWPSCRL